MPLPRPRPVLTKSKPSQASVLRHQHRRPK
jgi:hypothetical protein